MKNNPRINYRRSLRLKDFDYSQAGAYFVTICTHRQKNLFGNIENGEMVLNKYGRIVDRFWDEIPYHYPNVEIDWFIVMPNHMHGVIIVKDISNVGAIHELPLQNLPANRRKMLIPKIIGYFKMNTAKQINTIRNTPGKPVWQRNYYEHVIRNEEKLNKSDNIFRTIP